MGTPYIYYINSKVCGGTYIGQSKGSDSDWSRIKQHFSGLYHFTDKGNYISSTGNSVSEGTAFIDWLKKVPLDKIVTRVFMGPMFGIPKETWIDFISQWSTSMKDKDLDGKTLEEQRKKAWNKFLSLSDDAKLNMAEIIHIYNAKKRNYTLLQRQMGGQNLNIFKRGSNIVLNREASPANMVAAIDAHEGTLSQAQAEFDKLFKKDVLNNPKYIKLITGDKELMQSLKDGTRLAYYKLKQITDDYLQSSAYGNTTVLEMLLNAVKDNCKHSGYFTVSWPEKNDGITIYRKGRNELYDSLVSAVASQIQRFGKHLKTIDPEVFAKELEKTQDIYIGIASIVDIKLLVQYNGLNTFTPLGSYIDISPSLKRISYYYYAHFADMYYSRHSFEFGSKKYFNAEWDFFKKVQGETCTAFVYNEYRKQGIDTPYMENWSTWQIFNNGMLTVYTKNRGNGFLGNARPDPQIVREDTPYNQGRELPAFIFHIELPFADGSEPFYEVSQQTWNFVVSGYAPDIAHLTHY